MGKNLTEWTFHATNKQNLTQEILVMTKKAKQKAWNWTSSNISTEQRHKDYVKVKKDKRVAVNYDMTETKHQLHNKRML